MPVSPSPLVRSPFELALVGRSSPLGGRRQRHLLSCHSGGGGGGALSRAVRRARQLLPLPASGVQVGGLGVNHTEGDPHLAGVVEHHHRRLAAAGGSSVTAAPGTRSLRVDTGRLDEQRRSEPVLGGWLCK